MNEQKASSARGIDGNLTLARKVRRFPGAYRMCMAVQLALGALAAGSSLAVAGTMDRQPVAEITAAAEDFMQRRINETGRKLTAKAGKLDPRLELARCDVGLEGFLRPGTSTGSRTIVGVRCSGARPWKVYLPVDLIEMRPVLVARRALPRGHLLAADDLVLEERDVAKLAGGFVAQPDEAVGHRLKRQLVSGGVLAPSMLETKLVVRRGQSVTLVVRNDALNIRMAGKALMDGAIDQRIRVENAVSRRIVEGFVRSPEYVEVLVQ